MAIELTKAITEITSGKSGCLLGNSSHHFLIFFISVPPLYE